MLERDRTASVGYDRQNPANFTVAGSGTGVLALAETYAPGWRRVGANAEHASVQGWMNAWPLDGAIDTTLTYAPAHRARLALLRLFPRSPPPWELRASRGASDAAAGSPRPRPLRASR